MESHVIGITDSTLLRLEISDSNISIHDLCAQLPLTNTFPLTFQDSESCRMMDQLTLTVLLLQLPTIKQILALNLPCFVFQKLLPGYLLHHFLPSYFLLSWAILLQFCSFHFIFKNHFIKVNRLHVFHNTVLKVKWYFPPHPPSGSHSAQHFCRKQFRVGWMWVSAQDSDNVNLLLKYFGHTSTKTASFFLFNGSPLLKHYYHLSLTQIESLVACSQIDDVKSNRSQTIFTQAGMDV